MPVPVAVLVDGDNISSKHTGRILAAARGLGEPQVVRAYADATRGTDWQSQPGFRLMHAGSGKNAADLLLALDAMELALSRGVRDFVLASSDGDFTHLATRLREMGARVVGIGEAKAPEAFRAACSLFMAVGPGAAVTVAKPAPPKAAAPAQPPQSVTTQPKHGASQTDQQIRAIIKEHSQGGAGIAITTLNGLMRSRHDFRISTTAHPNWRGYFSHRSDLFEIDTPGPEAKVRYKPAGFTAAA